MTATNHVLAGSALALVVKQPALAVSVAFLLHFVLDALPHYGHRDDQSPEQSLDRLDWLLPADATVAAIVLATIAILHPAGWLLMVACGIACASPDLMWMPKFIRHKLGKPPVPRGNWLLRFHHWIQWCERGWGAYVEAVWCVGMGYIVLSHL
jgi:hypothetical protein